MFFMYLGRRLKINIALNPLKKWQSVTFPPDRGEEGISYKPHHQPATHVGLSYKHGGKLRGIRYTTGLRRAYASIHDSHLWFEYS